MFVQLLGSIINVAIHSAKRNGEGFDVCLELFNANIQGSNRLLMLVQLLGSISDITIHSAQRIGR